MTTSDKNRLFELINSMSDEEQRKLLRELEQRQSKDKRRHDRKPYSMSVDYVTNGHTKSGLIKDISVGGVLFETSEIEESFSVGEEILLTIPYPDENRYVKIRGQVVRIEPKRIAVKFERKFREP